MNTIDNLGKKVWDKTNSVWIEVLNKVGLKVKDKVRIEIVRKEHRISKDIARNLKNEIQSNTL